MIKKISLVLVILLLYHIVAITLLYTSDYLNVVSYYTHPPTKGEIELRRLPILFGDMAAISILKKKKSEAEEIVESGNIGLAAVLASYEHNTALSKSEAKRRSIKVAELLIHAGYDVSECEDSGRSTAKVLKDWGVLDSDLKNFLLEYVGDSGLFSCH